MYGGGSRSPATVASSWSTAPAACAVRSVGGMLGELAVKNQWAGIVVHGCVRDTEELARCATGIVALAAHPRRSDKRGEGERDVVVAFAGVAFRPGDFVYADADGLIVARTSLLA